VGAGYRCVNCQRVNASSFKLQPSTHEDYLKITFFAAGHAPLNHCPSKFTNPMTCATPSSLLPNTLCAAYCLPSLTTLIFFSQLPPPSVSTHPDSHHLLTIIKANSFVKNVIAFVIILITHERTIQLLTTSPLPGVETTARYSPQKVPYSCPLAYVYKTQSKLMIIVRSQAQILLFSVKSHFSLSDSSRSRYQ
jgi:hypothetical protein